MFTIDQLRAKFQAVIDSPTALRWAARTSKRRNDPWQQGACLVLAEAIVGWLSEDRVEIWELDGPGHVFVRVGDFILEGGGFLTEVEFQERWASKGGFDFSTGQMFKSSVAQAEHGGYEFDDYASEHLSALLAKAIDKDECLAVLANSGSS